MSSLSDGTLCPPCRTRALTRATAISALGSQRKNSTTRYPFILSFLFGNHNRMPSLIMFSGEGVLAAFSECFFAMAACKSFLRKVIENQVSDKFVPFPLAFTPPVFYLAALSASTLPCPARCVSINPFL